MSIVARGFLVFLGISAHPTTKGAEVLVKQKFQQESRIGFPGESELMLF